LAEERIEVGVTISDGYRCPSCGYVGRLITNDVYRGGLSSVGIYRGGFLRCPNCFAAGRMMKRRKYNAVLRLEKTHPNYREANESMESAVALQFPPTV
jgi:hypothetical protein